VIRLGMQTFMANALRIGQITAAGYSQKECLLFICFFFSSRRRHTRSKRDWSSDVCSSDLYKQLAARYRKMLQSLEKNKSAAQSPRVQEELARLAKEHQRIRDIDFFGAPSGAEVRRLEEAISMRTRRPETAKHEERPTLDLSKLRGKRWVTRPRPHVDRVASAWLIKKFIDPAATFVFATPKDFPGD